MRLLAMWVEDFLKIKNQSFNFGGQYTYSFDFNEESRELTISNQQTPDYYNLLTGSNIVNISGIIGINGSGKSSLLNLINVISAGKPLINNVVVIIENDGVIEITCYVSTFPLYGKKNTIKMVLLEGGSFTHGIEVNTFKNKNPFKELDLIFYSNLTSNRNVNYLGLDNPMNRSVDYQLRQSLTPEKVAGYLADYNTKKEANSAYLLLEESFNLQSIYQNDREERMINFLSDNIENKFSIIGDIRFSETISVWFNENIFSQIQKMTEGESSLFETLEKIYSHCYKLLNTESNTKNKFKYTIIYKYFFFALYNDFFKQTGILDYAVHLKSYLKSLPLDQNIFKSLSEYLSRYKAYKEGVELDKISTLLNNLDSLLENIEIAESAQFFSNGYFDLSINKHLWDFLKEILSITDFNAEPLMQYNITPFSSGEEAILYQLSEFHEALKNSTNEYVIVSIDEGELYLHPEWQRKYINTLYQFFEHHSRSYNKKFQIIITSHSPFIISDIPKQNLIFLKKDSLGNCKVSQSEGHLPTLGGNIFELFSDGFFLKEFISEYAFEKINQAIKFLNGEQSEFKELAEVENFNKLVGEALIRDEIQKMIDFSKMKNFDQYFEQIKPKD
ncbi:AAA family ATPase [Flavobacterium inviolabile]|uniref:AAA family ATPase n=1 Tax=Flavobacterium inviolabile TaxID=2748320 RepID=UPI0015ABB43F|nr:AAA family ATPase [Flavobacterium inviolabile]